MTNSIALTLVFCTLATVISAQDRDSHVSDAFGTKNPEELSLRGALDRLRFDEPHPMIGTLGYGAAKSGDHETAREIFTHLAERENAEGMTWLSWMEDNGLAGPEDPEAAADLDRRAMLAGSAVGAFNYGLDLLRGRGVERDDSKGRDMIRKAARMGDRSAKHLIENDYDLNAVTPDADEWKYQQNLF